jgi:nitrogen fixation-related uncharacterized protein
MDLAVYMIQVVFVLFFVGAAFALAASIVAGQWKDLDAASRLVLEIDDPYPHEAATDERA